MKRLIAVLLFLGAIASHAQTMTKGVFIAESVTVTFSATPTFDASKGNLFILTLAGGNVTSSTLSNARKGQELFFKVCQDGTGGRTFVAPTNVQNFVTIPSAANACILQSFMFDGTNALADQDLSSLLVSQSTNAATAGVVRLASGDAIDWRNNANAANIPLQKTGASSGNVPADTLDATGFGGIRTPSFISGTANPASAGAVALASSDCMKFRNNANGGDVNGVCKNASDQVQVGSGPFVIPSANDTAVGKATTDTLTNKTLGGSGSTSKDTFTNRFRASQGTTLVSGDFAASAGWGNTAALSAIAGKDAAFTFTVTANGTGIAANPTITLTYHDGTWTNTPIVGCNRGDGSAPTTGFWIVQAGSTATQLVLQFVGTPVSATAYTLYCLVNGF